MLGFFGGSDVFHYDLRGDSLQMEVCGNAGCLIDRFRGMDTSGLPDFMEFRCIFLFDTSESGIFDASRCISFFFRYEFSFFC